MAFEQRPEGNEGMTFIHPSGGRVQQCKGPEIGMSLAYLKYSKKLNVTG